VFISHTSDLAGSPKPRSFVAAAIDAVTRVGHAVVDMSYFSAAAQSPAEFCRSKLQDCNAYVGIFGHRYGSIVEGLDVSYTEMEFDIAGELKIPRLVFLVIDETQPADARQEQFRERVKDSKLLVERVSGPDDLETGILQSLMEMDRRPVTRTELRRTPSLALQFRQGEAEVPMRLQGQVIQVDLEPGPFELRLPAMGPDESLGICAYPDDSIFDVEGREAAAKADEEHVTFYFAPGTGMADTQYGSSTIWVTDQAHMHFDGGGRLERAEEGFDSVFFGNVGPPGGAATPLTEQGDPLYFVVARYDQVGQAWDYVNLERLVLGFGSA
jgi:Domain of unknown function (DUF4062)